MHSASVKQPATAARQMMMLAATTEEKWAGRETAMMKAQQVDSATAMMMVRQLQSTTAMRAETMQLLKKAMTQQRRLSGDAAAAAADQLAQPCAALTVMERAPAMASAAERENALAKRPSLLAAAS